MGWYERLDRRIGGVLPGGYVKPKPKPEPTPSVSTETITPQIISYGVQPNPGTGVPHSGGRGGRIVTPSITYSGSGGSSNALEAARKAEAARIEAARKAEAARIEAARIEAVRKAEAARKAEQQRLLDERKERGIKAKEYVPSDQDIYLPSGQIVQSTYGIGAGGTQTTVGTYQPREDQQYLRSFEAAIVPSLTLERTTYLPTQAAKDRYSILLEQSKYNPVARFKLDQFLKDQESQMKLDIREANAVNKLLEQKSNQSTNEYKKAESTINATAEKIQNNINNGKITFEEGNEALKIVQEKETKRLNQLNSDIDKLSQNKSFDKLKYAQIVSGGKRGQFGTGYDMALAGAERYKMDGKTVHLPVFGDVSGRAAVLGLKGGTEAYKAERDVLAFQLAGLGLGAVGLTAPAITGGATSLKALKVASAISAPTIGLSFGGLVGAKEFKRSGDLGMALATGIGTSAGFLGGVYSKEIVTAPGKMGKWIATNIHAPTSPSLKTMGKKGGTVLGTKSKLAEQQLQKYKAKQARMTEEQAVNEFKMRYKARSQQVNLIENSMKGKTCLSRADLNKDLSKWKNFLKKTGMTEVQITDRLGEVALRYQAKILLNNYNQGFITQQEFSQGSKKLAEALQKFRLKTQQMTIESQAPQIIQEQRYTLTEAAVVKTPQQRQLQKLLTLQSQGRLTNVQQNQLVRLQSRQQLKVKTQLQDSSMANMLFSSQAFRQRTQQSTKQESKQASLIDSMMDSFTSQVTKTQTKQQTLQKRILKLKTVQKPVPQNMVGSLIGGGSGIGRPIRPINPFPIIDFPDRKKYGRKKTLKKQPIKKKSKYVARITGFEAAMGGDFRLVEAGKKFTGFETVRGRAVRRPTKKKVVKKKVSKKKDNWGLY